MKKTSHCETAANKLADALDPWETDTQVNNQSAVLEKNGQTANSR